MTSAIGKLIGPYRLADPLARGELGQTLRAKHAATGELVAVKLFHEHISSTVAFADRFQPIVKAAADIKHPNVLPIRDFGVQGGQYYILMDFIPTGSLRTLLSQRATRLPLRRALDLMRQSAEGIAAAHARGVLHRDLKPENFLIEERGAEDIVRVADFGLTRLAETGLTIAGSLSVGSLPYMSPEQLRGITIDERSDVYSLGVVLYEIVTGFPPFQVQNLGDAIAKHVSAPPPSPRSLLSSIPETLEQLILRALEKSPAKRIQTVAEFSTLLQQEIVRLPGQPLVVWRGPAIAAPMARIVSTRGNGSGSARKRFALHRAPAGDDERTFPPGGDEGDPVEPRPQPTGPSKRIGVVLEHQAVTLVPGQVAVLTVTLMNSGRTVDAFSLAVRGMDESWVQTPAQPIRLNPNNRAVVPLSLLVPRVSASRAGTYPASIVAASHENPGEEGSTPLTVTVQPFAHSTLALVPPRKRGWKRGEYAVAISNQGNASAKYELASLDDEKALTYRLGSTERGLAPGESIDVPLVTSARLRAMGSPDIRTFTVTATSQIAGGATEPPKSVVGQFVHRALIPTWLPPLLVIGSMAAIFVVNRNNQLKQLSLTVVPQAMQLAVGSSAPLVATVSNTKNEAVTNGPPVTWTSRDTMIATVNDAGMVTGVHEGPTVITAASGKKSQAVQVAVSPAGPEQVTLSPKRLTLTVGSMAVLRASAKDVTGRLIQRDAMWLSSDPTVATVGGGRVVAKGPGTATITAQIESKSATADITVPTPPAPPAAPGAPPGAPLAAPPPGPAKPDEDCIAYEPSTLALSRDNAVGWRVTDGQAVLATLDRESEAKQALALARRFKKRCFVGRTNMRPNRSDYITDYWTSPTNVLAPIPNEVCRRYDRVTLSIKDLGAAGSSVEDQDGRLVFADTKADAQKVWNVAKDFSQLCVIGDKNGRPNKRDYMVQYWR
jgi:eukaryotic-like serine/threonine-protein kinase